MSKQIAKRRGRRAGKGQFWPPRNTQNNFDFHHLPLSCRGLHNNEFYSRIGGRSGKRHRMSARDRLGIVSVRHLFSLSNFNFVSNFCYKMRGIIFHTQNNNKNFFFALRGRKSKVNFFRTVLHVSSTTCGCKFTALGCC